MEDAIPKKHPLRKIKVIVVGVLDEMWPDFDGLYLAMGRPSIPPEQLLMENRNGLEIDTD